MNADAVCTAAEEGFVSRVMGENFTRSQSHEAFVDALTIDATRAEIVKLLRGFDEYCSEKGIKYFMFGNSLLGVVSYGDFLPGEACVDLGMLRSDFERLSAKARNDKAAAHCWELVETYEGRFSGVHRVRPLLRAKKPARVKYDGTYVFGDDSMPIEVMAEIELSIFDEVPDDFFMRKKFFRQMKRRNDRLKAALGAREYMDGAPDPESDPEGELMSFKRMSGGRALLRRLIPLRLAAWSDWRKAQKYKETGATCVTSVMFARSKTCPVADLGDMPYRDFAGIKVRTPERPDLWAPKPVLETTPELKRLQDDAKEIVKEIDRVCKELGIGYFACGGTMLGYVRHGGFIPWDDDIDVGMFRADYERFKHEAGAIIDSERFFLQTRETDPNIPYLFSKVRMNGTEYLTEYNVKRDFHKGICVDVFPFDYIPNSLGEQREFRAAVKRVEKRHNRIVNRQYPEPEDTHPKKNLDWAIAQVNGRLLARHYWKYSLSDTQHAYDEIAKTYDAKSGAERYEFVASFVPTYTMARVCDLLPFQRVEFDGIEISLPAHPEVFLRMQYGDFMALPYPHQRAGHDLLLWSDRNGIGGGRFADELGAEQ